ncbi:MAG: hypothetical protein Q8Q09_27805 [Deltaproteobacteria bacterium]|nr:hypothetical protein [Deltaproteobacteria bacterium]
MRWTTWVCALAVCVSAITVGPSRASAQPRCLSPSPTLNLLRNDAMRQLRAVAGGLSDVQIDNSSGVSTAAFSEREVGYVIADMMVRELAPMALERIGERAMARRLRRLAPVTSQQTAFRAQDLAEDLSGILARRMSRIRWTSPRGATIEVLVEAAAVSGYVATPGSISRRRYVTTVQSGIGATERVGLNNAVVLRVVRAMMIRAANVAHC